MSDTCTDESCPTCPKPPYGDTGIKYDVVAQWKEDLDLQDEAFPVFNMDYDIIEKEDGTFEGDAALFLAWRFVPHETLSAWYVERTGADVVEEFTGIPYSDAEKLVWPQVFFDNGVPIESITSQDFVSVLMLYEETGVVDWSIVLPEEVASDD